MPDTSTPGPTPPTAGTAPQTTQAGQQGGEPAAQAQAGTGRRPVTVLLPGAQQPLVTDTVYVSFSAEIIPKTTESLIALLANLVNQMVPHIYILFSTPGGSVMSGLNLYNVMKGLPCDLTIHNVGNVDSIGNAAFLAGLRRYACPHSTFMFHGVGFDINQGTRLEEKILRERLQAIEADHRRIGSILEERTQLSREQVDGLFREAHTKDSTFAVGCGIVHEIRDVQIPPGGPVVSLVFQR